MAPDGKNSCACSVRCWTCSPVITTVLCAFGVSFSIVSWRELHVDMRCVVVVLHCQAHDSAFWRSCTSEPIGCVRPFRQYLVPTGKMRVWPSAVGKRAFACLREIFLSVRRFIRIDCNHRGGLASSRMSRFVARLMGSHRERIPSVVRSVERVGVL